MKVEPGFGRFFLPGPTEVRTDVLSAMLRPMIPHRGAEFEELFSRLQGGLRRVFRTERAVFVSSSSATGLMEAAVRCAPAGAVLSLVNGAFSARFAEISSSCGHETDIVEAPWGSTVDLDEVERRLAMRRYAAVTVVHSETSTGALTDVRAVAEIAHRHGALCLVDSVSGVGGAPLHADEWELDFVLTGSQKAFALPPGLAFGVASAAYMRSAAEAPARGKYFDVVEFARYVERDETPNTPAISLLYALEVQLAAIADEGIERRWERHSAMARESSEWADSFAERYGVQLSLLAPEGSRSPTVSAIVLPESMRGPEVVAAVAERGFTIGTGYGKLKDRTIRIGHMGDHDTSTLSACLVACGDAITRLARQVA
ncbi:MAG TPA: alanine--glyoxylate aminotransferase family protein [Gemmatimonadaceae bacterium]|nr:alanine--glyoxylate aminotransferase family protein [Gemmatimonadaceae bacterium]